MHFERIVEIWDEVTDFVVAGAEGSFSNIVKTELVAGPGMSKK